MNNNDAADIGLLFLLIIPTAFLLALIVDRLTRRHFSALMAENSEASDTGATNTVDKLVVAASVPSIRLMSHDTIPSDSVDLRDELIRDARRTSRNALYADCLAALVYLVVPVGFASLVGIEAESLQAAPIVVFLGIALLVISLIRQAFFRRQFRARGVRSSTLGFLVVGLYSLLLHPNLRMVLLGLVFGITVIAAISAAFAGSVEAIGLFIAAAFHITCHVYFSRRIRSSRNRKLLVLRVFGIKSATEFLFDGVLSFWRHFGTFYAVVDPVFLKREYRLRNRFFILLLALTFVLVLSSSLIDQLASAAQLTAFAVLSTAVGFLYFISVSRQMAKAFVTDKDELLTEMARIDARPRAFNMSFKNLPLMCHANTWKMTVAECVQVVDAVVMDLRGFSESNSGCEYEVNFLLDVIDSDRVLFIVEEQSLAIVSQLILDKWTELADSSPNISKPDPTVHIYAVKAENNADIQGVLDLVLSASLAKQ